MKAQAGPAIDKIRVEVSGIKSNNNLVQLLMMQALN